MASWRAVVVALLAALAGTGCCRFCDRWCGHHYPPPAYGPPPTVAAAPIVAPAAAPAQCCVPCVPCCPTPCNSSPAPNVQAGRAPVPVVPGGAANWQRQSGYYPPAPACGCGP